MTSAVSIGLSGMSQGVVMGARDAVWRLALDVGSGDGVRPDQPAGPGVGCPRDFGLVARDLPAIVSGVNEACDLDRGGQTSVAFPDEIPDPLLGQAPDRPDSGRVLQAIGSAPYAEATVLPPQGWAQEAMAVFFRMVSVWPLASSAAHAMISCAA
ncbi:hypothetical protein [Nonomuraea sp. CA-141351]|uniref:hypothetical protein n=1 Tax=Nonomuraea sp. CA-141351 TaxID=3239996 RepID=UPI003D90FB3E